MVWQDHLSTAPFWLCAVESDRQKGWDSGPHRRFKKAGMATSQTPTNKKRAGPPGSRQALPPLNSGPAGEVSELLVIISRGMRCCELRYKSPLGILSAVGTGTTVSRSPTPDQSAFRAGEEEAFRTEPRGPTCMGAFMGP